MRIVEENTNGFKGINNNNYYLSILNLVNDIIIFKYGEITINYLKRGKGKLFVLLGGWGQTMGTWTFVITFFKRRT